MKKYSYTIYLKDWLGKSEKIVSFDSLRFCKKFIKTLYIPPFTRYIYIIKRPFQLFPWKKNPIVFKKEVKTSFNFPVFNLSNFRDVEIRSVFDYEK